jgi:hypothetical protein
MHSLIHGARPEEMATIAKMTVAEDRAETPLTRDALGEGLELIRQLILERGRRHDFDDQVDEPHDDVQWDVPCPDE